MILSPEAIAPMLARLTEKFRAAYNAEFAVREVRRKERNKRKAARKKRRG